MIDAALHGGTAHFGELKITVRALRAQNQGSEVAVRVLLEDGERQEERRLVLTVEQYCDLKLKCGEIDEDTFDRIEACALLCRAIRCGEGLLSYGSNSEQMLSQKLMQRGFGREVAKQAAAHLREVGLINEEKDMQREAEKCLKKLWGAKRIRDHMWSRGFGKDAMVELTQLLQDVDFSQNCATLICKHYGQVPADGEEKRRMIAFLGRYGYSIFEIRAAMSLVQERMN